MTGSGIPSGPLDSTPKPQGGAEMVGAPGRLALLDEALEGVELGAYDVRIVEWLCRWDWQTVATIASLIERARTAEVDIQRESS